ncbi:17941_t:CDS:2 [Cetraspora pellucida]|uniref:17941_t:CDS:1 n=1 Tax=Cetraspora pellucida TaxID=1433469 RepID=A0A9N9G8M2_9GLOM|nr:17941_t:CDS:2 [Cetraspora pellucida]
MSIPFHNLNINDLNVNQSSTSTPIKLGTSAVSSDVEGLMYQHAKDIGITLVTISHRPSLFKYHSHLLRLGDEGTCEFSTIGTEQERMSLEKEVAALEAKLKDVDSLKARIAEINKELQLNI